MTQFQIGQTYFDRAACDYDCIYSSTILARTAKTVTVNVHGDVVKRGLQFYDDVEQFKPFGTHSMCAVVRADKIAA